MNNTVLHDGQFSITKEQLRQLTDPKVREWFPEVFSLPKNFTGWVKAKGILNKKWLTFFENGFQKYGFDIEGRWFCQIRKVFLSGNDVEATEQEVFEALKNEAVKRGFVEEAFITPMHSNGSDYFPDNNIIDKPLSFIFKNNILGVAGGCDYYRVFIKGKWATIIQTITKSEAEKLLNKKIID